MPSSCAPSKDWSFNLSVSAGITVDTVIDSAANVVGLDNIYSVQHLGHTSFQVVVFSAAASRLIIAKGHLEIGSEKVAIDLLDHESFWLRAAISQRTWLRSILRERCSPMARLSKSASSCIRIVPLFVPATDRS